MSDDTIPYNVLTLCDDLARLLAIDPMLAQKICLAVAKVVAQGYGEVQIIVADHAVRFIETKLSEKL